MRIILLLILLSLNSDIFAKKQLSTLAEIMSKSERFFYTNKKEIRAELADSSKSCYVAYAFMTLPINFEKATPYFLDIENYEHLFKYIVDMRSVKDKSHPKDSIYYIEGKSFMVHGWGLGRLEELTLHPDTLIDLKVRPASSWIVNRYRKARKGIIRYYVKNVYLDGKLIKIDEKHCRIGIRGVTTTNKPMPMWLVSIIMKIIFPGLINDAVKKINSGWKCQEYLHEYPHLR